MQDTRILSKSQMAAANEAVKSMGLRVFSGSYNADNLHFDIMIDKGCAATYNEKVVVERLMEVLGARAICLDGKNEF